MHEDHYIFIDLVDSTVEEISKAWHALLEQVYKYHGFIDESKTRDEYIQLRFQIPEQVTDTVLVYLDTFRAIRVLK